MKRFVIGLLIVGTAACSRSAAKQPQQEYEVVQEGAASGVTDSLSGPGEPLPPLTGTNADTTTAFALNPATTAAVPDTSGGSFSDVPASPVPPPASPSTPATNVAPPPETPTPATWIAPSRRPARPPVTAPPPPPARPVPDPEEVEPPPPPAEPDAEPPHADPDANPDEGPDEEPPPPSDTGGTAPPSTPPTDVD